MDKNAKKICTKCGEEKLLKEFSRHTCNTDGRQSGCKVCERKASKARYHLKMYIGKMLVEKYELDYTEMTTSTEKEEYQCGISNDLYNKHIGKIRQAGKEPVFFVDGNTSDFDKADDTLSYGDLKLMYRLEEAVEQL